MFLLKPKNEFTFTDEEITKALTSLAIQTSISSKGNESLKKFEKKLFDKYACYFSDCLEHPEYLMSTIHESYADSDDILHSIIMKLDSSSNHKTIAKFLIQIKQHVKSVKD